MDNLKQEAEHMLEALADVRGIGVIARYIGYLEGKLEALKPPIYMPSPWTTNPSIPWDPLFKDSGDGSFTTYTTDRTTKNKED